MEERGHYKDGSMYFWIGRQQVKRCPLTFISSISWEYIEAYRFFEKGIIPNGLGYRKESNKFIQALGILANEFARWEKKRMEDSYKNRSKALK